MNDGASCVIFVTFTEARRQFFLWKRVPSSIFFVSSFYSLFSPFFISFFGFDDHAFGGIHLLHDHRRDMQSVGKKKKTKEGLLKTWHTIVSFLSKYTCSLLSLSTRSKLLGTDYANWNTGKCASGNVQICEYAASISSLSAETVNEERSKTII